MNAPDRTIAADTDRAVTAILFAISLSHLLNDTIQTVLTSNYPLLRQTFALSFVQIGIITFVFQTTASLLQPLVGTLTDRRPMPYSLPIGMGASLVGVLLLAVAPNYGLLLVASALIGIGSSIFHPEASRVARLASGGRHGLAQSIFQVGGNFGQAIGPVLAAIIVAPRGQGAIAWFAIAALVGIVLLWRVSRWYSRNHLAAAPRNRHAGPSPQVPRSRVVSALAVLIALLVSKFFYLAAITSYYTFYVIDRFGVSLPTAQILLFVFLGAVALGTVLGGPIGDRFGRKYVIWASILGVLPFTLVLPHVGLAPTAILSVFIGFGLASAFPAIVVYAQELMPGKIGMVSGLLFGLAFGMGGLGAAAFGALADFTSIEFVFQVSAFLPALGLLTVLLPNIESRAGR